MIEPTQGRVVHAVPGRVRVKLDRADLSEAAGGELCSALTAIPGVEQARFNSRTGSLVIQYERSALDVAGLVELARSANLLALDAVGADSYPPERPLSLTAQQLVRTFGEVDAQLAELTNGRWDLRSVVPAAFGLLALRALVSNPGALSAAPWYVLAWYAFDSFWKMNEAARRPPSERALPPPGDE